MDSKGKTARVGNVRPLNVAAIVSAAILSHGALVNAQTAEPGRSNTNAAASSVEEVIVTGTLIRGVQPTGSELVTLDRESIVNTGAQSTTNLMTNLPQLASFSALPIGTVDFANPVPRFNIRNSGATLVLLNGHRMVGSGILQTTPDPSAIPISAIERVEVLPDGASATYGADAVGGVVNFILRDSYDGAETRVAYGVGDEYNEYDVSQLFGKSWGSGNILGSFEYTAHNNFAYGERSFYDNDVSEHPGGRSHFLNNCPSPNVVISGVSYATPALAPNTRNFCDPNGSADLLPEEHRATWFLAGSQSLTENIDLSGDAIYSQRTVTNHVPSSTSVFTMSSANPYFRAPPGVSANSATIQYQFADEFGPTRPSVVELTSLGAYLALNIKLGADWRAMVSGNYGKGTTEARTPAVDGVALTAAANATTLDAAFDPFGGRTNPNVVATIGGGGVAYESDQDLQEGQISFDGPLFDLPGGAVRVAFGAQWRRESIDGVPYQLVNGNIVDIPRGPQSGSRRDLAEYVELSVPIVGSDNALPGMQSLVLSLAGRHDDYSDFGTTTNPKFALDYLPIDSLILRASASTSFQAPSLADTHSVDSRLQTQSDALFTPIGRQAVPEIYIAGGTPTLQPQEAETYTFGFEVHPGATGFRGGATYWHSNIKKQIGQAFPAQVPLFTNPAFSTFWWGPGGQPLTAEVLDSLLSQFRVDAANAAFTPAYRQALLNGGYIVDLRRKNLGETTLDGIDFHLSYDWTTALGNFSTTAGGTRQLNRKNIPGPGAPEADRSYNDPQVQGRVSFDWNLGSWRSGLNVNYVGRFTVTGTDVGSYRVDRYTTADARVTYQGGETVSFLEGTDITLQVNNIFDEEPPFVLGTNGYSALHANQIGRLVSLSLLKRW